MDRSSLQFSELLYSGVSESVQVHSGTLVATSAPVAIKIRSHPQMASANSAVQEAMTQASLQHPNVVSIYGCFFEQYDTSFYSFIVSELMFRDLRREVELRASEQRPWSAPELTHLLAGLVEVLALAEQRCISHRDIKPSNLFLSRDCATVKIGDFGSSARGFEGKRSLNSVAGTPLYLSPEWKAALIKQISGVEEQVDINPYQSDVYSLGITVLELATLRTPQEFAMMDISAESVQRAVGTMSGYPQLQHLVYRMLAINPAERITFTEIQTALQSAIEPAMQSFCECCRNPCADRKWQRSVEKKDLEFCVSVDACSLICFQILLQHKNQQKKCAGCDKTLRFYHRNQVVLTCGHTFHEKKCLFKYLSASSNGFQVSIDYRCPRCYEQISSNFLSAEFDGWLEKYSEKKIKRCKKCEAFGELYIVDPCKHLLCSKCMGFSSSTGKCVVCAKSRVESLKESWNKVVSSFSCSPK